MSSAPRVLLGGLIHETHTFVAQPTLLADFAIHRGPQILARAGDGSTIDGFLEVGAAEGWQLIPSVDYYAQASGPIDHAVFEQFWAEFELCLREALAEGPLAGILLTLHGAGVTTRVDDLEGELLRRLRDVPGCYAVPVWVVFDLHGNFTDAMALYPSGLVGYRENPHTDARASAVRAAQMLARTLQTGFRPRSFAARAPVLWPPTGTGTADSPMKDLEALARAIEAEDPEIWCVSVNGGFSFSDVADAGVAFVVSTVGSEARARAALDRLVALAIALRDAGQPDEWDIDAAIADLTRREGGPYLLVEPADNIGGGAPGDCTSVLRALIRNGVAPSLVVIADPEAVAGLQSTAIGGTKRLKIGGKGTPFDPGPVELEVTLVSRSDGNFRLEDRNSHMIAASGENIRMGPSAVVTCGPGVTILLNSIKTAPMDLGQLRSQGIEPGAFKAIGVKAAVSHRQAYTRIMAGTYTVETPGPCTSNLHSLPYRKLRRPVYPLDPLPNSLGAPTESANGVLT